MQERRKNSKLKLEQGYQWNQDRQKTADYKFNKEFVLQISSQNIFIYLCYTKFCNTVLCTNGLRGYQKAAECSA